MAARKITYVHKETGELKVLTRQSAKKLDDKWSKVEFLKNEDGVQVMRLKLEHATVDVSENQLKGEIVDGDPGSK